MDSITQNRRYSLHENSIKNNSVNYADKQRISDLSDGEFFDFVTYHWLRKYLLSLHTKTIDFLNNMWYYVVVWVYVIFFKLFIGLSI